MVQSYTPPPAFATDATLLVELACTFAGALMVRVPADPTVTTCDVELVQPLALVAVTEYVVVAVGVTVMLCVVAPLDQRYVLMFVPLALSVTGMPGWQDTVGPVIATVGSGFTVTVVGDEAAEQPPASVTVTV